MATTEFIAAGGNRQSSAADWKDGVLAFGSDTNVAICEGESITTLLKGHTDTVTCVRIGNDIVSGAADKTVRIWQGRRLFKTLQHDAPINTLTLHDDLIITGTADAKITIWKHEELRQIITLKPRYLPLATAVTSLDDLTILAVAGTSTSIQIFASQGGDFELKAILTGHEGWIRSLDFSSDNQLASASQDKFIRLWRFSKKEAILSNKVHRIGDWTVQYDALLIGHEDWIYTVRWKDDQLLSASADNSLAIWKYSAGLWICDVRLGEISSMKGSTTATGSTGGFFIGLWADGVVSLGRTGSWRKWNEQWEQQVGITGHTKEVQSVAWSPDGAYLLSTSLDQTTRLWADRDGWHELARPQIHGYDLQCIATVPNQFVSGADEKLLRVFNQPGEIGTITKTSVPVLGLSNKAAEGETVEVGIPLEDDLARFTLWPEHEKLYGHGYEISAVASNKGTLIATSCKASTIDHAVIRIYETKTWREVKALTAHSLTVTALAFSPDEQHLLSVGRDRQWAVFDCSTWQTIAIKNGHSRMILDCDWASPEIFATAGRDKTVKLWRMTELIATFSSKTPVTALAIQNNKLAFGNEAGQIMLVQGNETWQDCTPLELDTELWPAKTITSLAWRPGEDTLAVASEDHSIRILRLSQP